MYGKGQAGRAGINFDCRFLMLWWNYAIYLILVFISIALQRSMLLGCLGAAMPDACKQASFSFIATLTVSSDRSIM
jgi:hypothetical protein